MFMVFMMLFYAFWICDSEDGIHNEFGSDVIWCGSTIIYVII